MGTKIYNSMSISGSYDPISGETVFTATSFVKSGEAEENLRPQRHHSIWFNSRQSDLDLELGCRLNRSTITLFVSLLHDID